MQKTPLYRFFKAPPSLWLMAAMLLVVAVGFGLYVRAERKIDRANEQRLSSFVLADQLRQSSSDLSRMARSYAATGDPLYVKYYQDILDIRDGRKPRPEGYFHSYWDLVMADPKLYQPGGGQAISLLDLMRQTGFADEEFSKLAEAKANSDALAATELKAMKLVESGGPEASANRLKARLMLNDAAYLQAKAVIMRPINASFELMDKRTAEQVHYAERAAMVFRATFVLCTLVTIFMLWQAYAAIRKILGGSAQEVHAHIERIARGDLSSPVRVAPGMEHSVLAGLLSMQTSLRTSQLRQNAIFAASPDAMLISDTQGLITQANQQAESLLGYSGDEFIGLSVDALVPERLRAEHPQQRAGFAASPGGRRMGHGLEVKARRKDGREVDVEVSLSRIATDQGFLFVTALHDISERLQQEEQIHQLLAEKDTVLNNAMVGIAYLKHRQIVFCNRRLEEIFQYDPGELTGESSERLYDSQETFDQMGAVAYIALAKSRPYSTEVRLRHKDGSVFWGSLSGRVIDPARPDEGSIWIYADISKLKLAEDDLRIAATAFEAHQGIVVTDVGGTIVRVNPAFSQITGYLPEEAVGRKMSFLRSGKQSEDFYSRMWETINKDGTWQGEIWNRIKNGEVHPHWVTIATVRDAGNAITNYVGTYTDLTDRQEALTALQTREAWFRGIFENTHTGIASTDDKGRVTSFNEAFRAMLGYDAETLGRMNFGEFTHSDDLKLESVFFNEILAGTRDHYQITKRYIASDGRVIWTDLSVAAVRGEHGTVENFVAVIHDISERRAAEQLLTESISGFAEGFTIYDENDRLVLCNEAYLDFYTTTRDLIVPGASFAEIVRKGAERGQYEEAIGRVEEWVQERVRIHQEADGSHLEQLLDDGRWLLIVEYRTPSGFIVGNRIDITARKLAEAALKESHDAFHRVLETTLDGFWQLDKQGRLLDVNPAYCRQSGYAREELLGMHAFDLEAKESAKETAGHIRRVLEDGSDQFESMHRRKDGGIWHVETSATYQAAADGQFFVFLRDITDRQRSAEDLRIAATAFESMEGMMVTDVGGVILKVNKAFTEITGYTAAEIVGRTPQMLQSGRHDADFYREMWETIGRAGGWQGEIWDRRKNGEVYPKWLSISAVKSDEGEVTHYIGTHLDITERKKAEAKIEELAFFDQLTGLPNRTLLQDRLKQATTSSSRTGSYGALLFIDLDNFKTLNDTLGHEMGDQLLKQVAQRLTLCVREGDTVARLGGDEFVVILANLSMNEREAAAGTETAGEKILAALNKVYSLGIVAHHSTVSIGATLFKGASTSNDELMKQADLTMYKSKEAGRNTIRFFDPAMEIAVKARTALESDLRSAVVAQQFLLHYQAQVADGKVTGAEALVRWKHPDRGMVSPAEFIPLAEETGLILSLGHWVLETACTQLAGWAARPELAHLTVAVNVSARQFSQPDFVDQVLAVLKSTGANPLRLKLELTESMLADNVQDIIEKMFSLKAKGVGFSLDDFGTGYSSLSYLKRLPLDQLKIDQSFVRDVMSDPNDAAIAKTIVALAQSLGLGVIAEGVETEAQRDFLASFGCHACQGYFFSRPLAPEGFEAFVKQG